MKKLIEKLKNQETKNKRVSFRFRTRTAEKLTRLAAKHGVSLSEYVGQLIDNDDENR